MVGAKLQAMASREWVVLLAGVAALSWARRWSADGRPSAGHRLVAPGAGGAPVALSALTRREELRLLDAGMRGADACRARARCRILPRHLDRRGTAIVATQPLIVGLGAWVALGERPTRALLIAIAIAGAGALLLAGADLGDGVSLRGDAFAALGAVSASIYLVAGRRVRARLSNVSAAGQRDRRDRAADSRWRRSGDSPLGWGAEAYILIALLALVPQLMGHGALTWALGSLPAAVVAVAVLGEPVGATAIGATLLGERPTLLEAAGAALLLVGVYVALRGGLSLVRGEDERAR